MFVNDKLIVRAAQAIWDEDSSSLSWTQADPADQRRYIRMARAALLAVGMELA